MLSKLKSQTAISAALMAASLFCAASVLVAWEVLGSADPRSAVPAASVSAQAAWRLAFDGRLLVDALSTGQRIVAGYATGVLLGVVVGILTSSNRWVRAAVEPLVQVARPVPAVALIPLSLAAFGIDFWSQVFIVIWASFFPIWVSTHHGISNVPHTMIWTATVLGCRGLTLARRVRIPAALPYIVTGARVGLGLAFAAVVVAEISGAQSGLGYLIHTSHQNFQHDEMMAGIVYVGVFGAAIDRVFLAATRALFPWMHLHVEHGSL